MTAYAKTAKWQRWTALSFVILLLYSLLKVSTRGDHFVAQWLTAFLTSIEVVLSFLSHTLLNPIGLILLAVIWLIKTGELYLLFNKFRYMRLAKGEQPAVEHVTGARQKLDSDPAKPLTDWQKNTLADIRTMSNPYEQQQKCTQLVGYQLMSDRPETLPLLQFLHHYRRDDISFYQVAQFLAGEGWLGKDLLTGPELNVEATVLGYIDYLQHAGLMQAYVTLQSSPDGFYGIIRKVKVPNNILEIMQLCSKS